MNEELYNSLIRQGVSHEEAYRRAMRDSYDTGSNFTGPMAGNPYNFNPEDELGSTQINPTQVTADMAFNPSKFNRSNNPMGAQVDDRGRIIAPATSGRSRFDNRFGVEQPDYSGMIDPSMNREENIQMLMSSEYGAGLTEEEAIAAYEGTSQTSGRNTTDRGGAFPYINPWGGDLNTNAYMLGRSIGADKGTQGRGLGIVSGVGNLGLGLARTIGSGIANQSETQRNYLDFLERRNRGSRQYTNQQTSRDQNYMGGSMEFGGEHGGGDDKRKQFEGKSYFYNNPDDYKKWKSAAKYGSGQMSPEDAMVLNVPGEGQAHIPLSQITDQDIERYNRYAMLQDMSVNAGVELSPEEKAEVKKMRRELGFSFEDGGIFRKRYGDVDYKEFFSGEKEGMTPGLSVSRRQARDIRNTVNRNIREGYVDESGLDYGQFSRVRTKDFMYNAPEKIKFEEGGDMPQEQPQQQIDPDTQEEIQVLATQLSEEFQTIEEAGAYLQEQGIEPQMVEMILEVFRMIKEEQGVVEGQQEELPASQVMRNTMSGDMSVDMGFKYGGRKNKVYPKI